MAEYTVSVKGLREVVRSFNQYEGAIKDLKEANYAIGSKVSKTASAIAPNETGALAGSIRAMVANALVTKPNPLDKLEVVVLRVPSCWLVVFTPLTRLRVSATMSTTIVLAILLVHSFQYVLVLFTC